MLYNRVVIVQNHDLAKVSAHRSWATCLSNVSFSGSSGAFQHKQTGLYSQMLQISDPKTTGQLFTGTPGPPVSKPSRRSCAWNTDIVSPSDSDGTFSLQVVGDSVWSLLGD